MNVIAIKSIEKVVLNSGIGRLATQPNFDKVLPEIVKDFALIAGQKPSLRSSRQSISGFKMREGQVVGLTSTLRGKRMADFLEKLSKIVLPRVRDFRGIKDKSVDEGGNLNIGIKENFVFPEINSEVSKINFGVEITLVPKLRQSREEAIKLYKGLGIPFKK